MDSEVCAIWGVSHTDWVAVQSCVVFVCVRVTPEALLLLLVRSSTRGVGQSRYDVQSALHLSLCSGITTKMWDEYYRQGGVRR